MNDVAAAEAVYVVGVFDIDDYVYFVFRELALESSVYCGKTYYSRVARVCKVFVWFCPVFLLLIFDLCKCTLSLKKGCHFYFCSNFGKCRPILIILSLLYSQISC